MLSVWNFFHDLFCGELKLSCDKNYLFFFSSLVALETFLFLVRNVTGAITGYRVCSQRQRGEEGPFCVGICKQSLLSGIPPQSMPEATRLASRSVSSGYIPVLTGLLMAMLSK